MADETNLISVPFQGISLYGHRTLPQLGLEDQERLKAAFRTQIRQLLPHMGRFDSYVYIPLGEATDGYAVSFQGRFGLEDVLPFLSRMPNALLVTDGRMWGYLRFQLLCLDDGGEAHRVAEIEIYPIPAREASFEIFWGPDGRSPVHQRFYAMNAADPVAGGRVRELVRGWGERYRLVRTNPDMWRGDAPPRGPFAAPGRDRRRGASQVARITTFEG